jgi:hypothetical protein
MFEDKQMFMLFDKKNKFFATRITAIHFDITGSPTCVDYCANNSDMGPVVECWNEDIVLLKVI